MIMQFTILLLAFHLTLASDIESVIDDVKSRKHYGMSYHVKCENYIKSFTCMSACKSIGFQVFRMDHRCKCSCHELKTTTILPFFKWLTNGTTQKWHKTQSVPLYHIVGTLSPPTYMDYSEHLDTTLTTEGIDKTQESGKTTSEADPTVAGQTADAASASGETVNVASGAMTGGDQTTAVTIASEA